MGDVSNSLAESWYFSAELPWQPAVVGPDMVLCCYELYHWQERGPTPTKVTLSLLVTRRQVMQLMRNYNKQNTLRPLRDPSAQSQFTISIGPRISVGS